jgi:hypothetical protein
MAVLEARACVPWKTLPLATAALNTELIKKPAINHRAMFRVFISVPRLRLNRSSFTNEARVWCCTSSTVI